MIPNYKKQFEESSEDIAERVIKQTLEETVAPRLLKALKEFSIFDQLKNKSKEFISEIVQHILSDEAFLHRLSAIVIKQIEIDVKIAPKKEL